MGTKGMYYGQPTAQRAQPPGAPDHGYRVPVGHGHGRRGTNAAAGPTQLFGSAGHDLCLGAQALPEPRSGGSALRVPTHGGPRSGKAFGLAEPASNLL